MIEIVKNRRVIAVVPVGAVSRREVEGRSLQVTAYHVSLKDIEFFFVLFFVSLHFQTPEPNRITNVIEGGVVQ